MKKVDALYFFTGDPSSISETATENMIPLCTSEWLAHSFGLEFNPLVFLRRNTLPDWEWRYSKTEEEIPESLSGFKFHVAFKGHDAWVWCCPKQ